jgi:phenylacetate-coenzyme A ligase PaaK-like adenylate-forming protein
MFETGVRQLRMALSMISCRRIDPDNIGRLVQDALDTFGEFGGSPDAAAVTDGPFTDPVTRAEFQNRAVHRTAERLGRLSPFYGERFAAAGVEPAKLSVDTLPQVPTTDKRDLIRRPADFRCAGVQPVLTTRTTGTTGRPAEVWLSRYEIELWPAIAALSGVLREEILPTDHMQVNVSSRATAAVYLDMAVCRLAGAGCRALGIVPPEEALSGLTDGATLLATYPSYLAELVLTAQARGLRPADFSLRRIDVGGEVLSPALAAAARVTFGVPQVSDSFGMTEVLPVSGRRCEAGHLHQDPSTGLVEVLDLAGTGPAGPGELGTAVITPYYPYRECMPVFRYDTRDVVRRLPDRPLGCELAGVPATSTILGKADQLLWPGGRPVTPRDLVEAYEALPTRPWPARFGAEVRGGRLRLTVPHAAVDGYGHRAVVDHFADRGLDADLALVPDELATALRPLRCDLRETTFAEPALAGI